MHRVALKTECQENNEVYHGSRNENFSGSVSDFGFPLYSCKIPYLFFYLYGKTFSENIFTKAGVSSFLKRLEKNTFIQREKQLE